jgi:hypothetical protein
LFCIIESGWDGWIVFMHKRGVLVSGFQGGVLDG